MQVGVFNILLLQRNALVRWLVGLPEIAIVQTNASVVVPDASAASVINASCTAPIPSLARNLLNTTLKFFNSPFSVIIYYFNF